MDLGLRLGGGVFQGGSLFPTFFSTPTWLWCSPSGKASPGQGDRRPRAPACRSQAKGLGFSELIAAVRACDQVATAASTAAPRSSRDSTRVVREGRGGWGGGGRCVGETFTWSLQDPLKMVGQYPE